MTNHVSTRVTVAEFISDLLAVSDKTQREISEECGFENPNIITMLKNGATKIPFNRIGPLAKALNADPAYLLRLVMTEYMPDTWAEIENSMQCTVLTSSELALVRAYRNKIENFRCH